MRAAVLTDDRPKLALADVADPSPAAGEVLVRVTACGVCGSDLHVNSMVGARGAVLGHEIAGIVDEVGPGVVDVRGDVRPGAPVAVRPLTGCGTCRWCRAGRADHCDQFAFIGLQRPGGFAEALTVPADSLFVLPTTLAGTDQALVEPLAIARRALRRGGLVAGERVAVLGGGPIGLAVVAWARALGAERIGVSEPTADRRSLALALGADAAVDPRTADAGAALTDALGGPPQLVLECSGRPGLIQQAMLMAAVDGRVVVVGICTQNDEIFPWFGLHKELDVRFAVYYGAEDFTETIDGLGAGSLGGPAMITRTVDLDGLVDHFHLLAAEPDGGKTVVCP